MAEDNIQGKPPPDQVANTQAPTEKKQSLGQKIGGALRDMRGFLSKSKEKAGAKPLGKIKAGPDVKKPAVPVAAAFSVQKLDLKSVNQVLILILVGLIGLTFYVSFRTKPDIASVMSVVSKIKFLEVEPKTITPFKELSDYLGQVKKRDVFSAYQEKKKVVEVVAPVKVEPPPPPKVPIEDKAKHLKLIGISWGNNPKAIIRDNNDQSMYFVSEGETIKGTELVVDTILKEEVIISSEGETMSML